jgi:hypothetical protein
VYTSALTDIVLVPYASSVVAPTWASIVAVGRVESVFPDPAPSLTKLEGPRCAKCRQSRMSLARAMPGPKALEIRTFACAKCNHVQTISVECDREVGRRRLAIQQPQAAGLGPARRNTFRQLLLACGHSRG